MDRLEFEKLVEGAISKLPPKIRSFLDNVAIVIEEKPTAEQLKQGGTSKGSLLLGLYQGIPKTKRGISYTLVLPDKITIFQKSIEAVAATPQAVEEQVRRTVYHEIAHHFGFDEPGVKRLERKRFHG